MTIFNRWGGRDDHYGACNKLFKYDTSKIKTSVR